MIKSSNIPSSLIFAVFLSLAMFCLVPHACCMAVSVDSPFMNHFIYMFGHASYLHYFINAWCLICLSMVITARRFFLAYISSVAVSCLCTSSPLLAKLSPCLCISSAFLPKLSSSTPSAVIGFSVILFWFYGYIAPYLWHRSRSSVIILLVLIALGFLFPWIASTLHLVMFLIGFSTWHIESFTIRLRHFLLE